MRFTKQIILIFTTWIFLFNISIADVGTEFNNLIKDKHNLDEYPYLENRKDIGVFYDFTFDYQKKIIKIKRNENNYPIVRFSLFNKKNLKPGNVVTNYNDIDLSKLKDNEIIELHKKIILLILKFLKKKIFLSFIPTHIN
jgi:hypothetical protein